MAGNRDIEQQRRRLSLRLYDILENVGASEKIRKLHIRTGTASGIITTVGYSLNFDQLYPIYLTGSTYEGSVTPDLSSDIDVIICFIYPPVVLNPLHAPAGASLLVVRDEWTYHGYVKLQAMEDGFPLTRYNAIPNKQYSLDEVGRLCRRHFNGENMDGPADRKVDKNGVHIKDFVGALKCNVLPVFASNRLVILRQRNLINAEECEQLNKIGCMFVSTGFFLSSEEEIEWRQSFSLQERHLMSKLNPTQHKVFILLKMIKTNIIEKVINSKVFTSYHCKTCVLYAVEMTSARAWTPDNLINCLLQCIKLLILWLKRGYCPNFFNIDCNLFFKKGFSQFRKQILQSMELLLQSNNHFLRLLQSDHVGDILTEGEWRWRSVIDVKRETHIAALKYTNACYIVTYIPKVLHSLCGGHFDTFSLISALDTVQQTQNITELSTVETHKALRYLYPSFHLHIAKSLVCSSIRCHNRSYKKQILRLADIHFRKAEMTDLVNVRLARAAILYASERYESCFMLLQQIDNEYTHKVRRICPCLEMNNVLYRDDQEKIDQNRTVSGISVRKIMKRFVAHCVTFLPSDFGITPQPLQYEMFRSLGTQPGSRIELVDFWFDWSVIDAKIFLYLLLYLASTKLQKEAHKQVAIGNILAEIEENNRLITAGFPRLGHRETAYNLLGWIYMQEQRYGDAIQCFLKSWEVRPFHNAAKFHMRDLLTKVTEMRRNGSF